MELNESEREKQTKLARIRALGINPFPPRAEWIAQRVMAIEAADRAKSTGSNTDNQNADQPEQASHTSTPTQPFSVMGRVIRKNTKGKVSFAHIEDESGKVQFFARLGDDSLSAERFQLWDSLIDVGDWVEAVGIPFLTKAGEPSLRISAWNLLSKAITPLPLAKEEKQTDGSIKRYSAFADPDLRFRQRYTDLAVNPEVRDIFIKRARLVKGIRDFMDSNGFLEVETPILQPLYGGAAARPFTTHHNQLDQDLYLRISYELYLKRLLVGNIERVYEIGRDFRNEGVSFKHNPEFTQIEFYAAYMDVFAVMELTERMIQAAARAVLPASTNGISQFRGNTINWFQPFARQTMRDAICEHTKLDYTLFPDAESLGAEIVKQNLMSAELVRGKTRGKLIDSLLGDYVEKTLIQPTFLYDYPRDISPLAKSKVDDPATVERFEGFIGGMELCNAFTELNDPFDQEQRFLDEQKGGDDEAQLLDEDYIRAMRYGMPPNGGFGMGIDRLAMLLTDKDTIREVILFPHLRQG